MTLAIFIFELAVFIFSVIVHEVSHGLVAERLGDPTARLAGRLTFNPLVHLDLFGSIILPLLLAVPALFGAPAFIFGWAKPVPYDPRNLENPKTGGAMIAAAGPLSNIAVAVIFGIFIRLAPQFGFDSLTGPFAVVVYVNVLLALFNLVPIPPLDGSKVLYAFLPRTEAGYRIMMFLEQFGLLLLLAFLFWGFGFLSVIVQAVFALIVGRPLAF